MAVTLRKAPVPHHAPTLHLTTDKLRTGDVVLTHGMRVLIDGPIRTEQRDAREGGQVYSQRGLVLNEPQVRADGIVPASWLHYGASSSEYQKEPRWTIQGNHLARWTVQRDDTRGACGVPGCDGPTVTRAPASPRNGYGRCCACGTHGDLLDGTCPTCDGE